MMLRNTLALSLPLAALGFLAAAFSGCGDDMPAGTGPTSTSTTGTMSSSSSSMPMDKSVVVLFTSDEHSHLFSFSPELDDYPTATAAGDGSLVGGVARRAAVLAKERKAASDAGKGSLLVSAGDNQMGAFPHIAFESASVDYGTMYALKYDVTTLGNHEFDFGPKALANSIAAAGSKLPPIVASNIHFDATDMGDDDLAKLVGTSPTGTEPILPYRIVMTDNGLKVGVFGWVGVNAEHVAPNKTPVKFSAYMNPAADEGDNTKILPQLYKDLQPIVDKLHDTEKVDLVIGLSHGGIQDSSSDATIQQGEDYLVGKNVTGIDLIVSGHAHNGDPKPIPVANAKGKTLVLNGGAFGRVVGRVEFTVHADGSAATWDTTTQTLIPVDDKTIPDATVAGSIDGIVDTIEKTPYLASLLTTVSGTPVMDDVAKHGDLYFFPIGKTAFDVTDTKSLIYLSADSMLAAADAAGTPADMGLESQGVIRNVLSKGKTGTISAADAFSVVPLGASPVNGSLGYPLIRAYISLFYLRAVFEFSLSQGKVNTDFNLGQAGVKVEYDASRPLVMSKADLIDPAKGQVMKIFVDSNHADGFEQYDKLIYDRVGMVGSNGDLVSVVTSSYIAQFASDVGAQIVDSMNMPTTIPASIMHRPDNSEIKAVESFMTWIKASPTLPDLYDPTSANATKRLVCVAAMGCP